MEVMIERACGLDVHKKSITACVITQDGKEIVTFRSHTRYLMEMIDWIKQHGCTHVATESTGVYWKPIVNLLDSAGITYYVVNAAHMKAVPGRKTDVKDAEWIADLLRHGLLTASYIPNRYQRELREMVRYRRSLIQERARELNRVQKVLEGANIKLSAVISNVMGVSGREMLEALIEGETDSKKMAEMDEHQRLMLKTMISHIDFLDDQIKALDGEVANDSPLLKKTWNGVIPSLASPCVLRSRLSLTWELKWNRNFLTRLTYARGQVLFQVKTKVPANGSHQEHVKGTNTFALPSSNQHTPWHVPRRIWEPNTDESQCER